MGLFDARGRLDIVSFEVTEPNVTQTVPMLGVTDMEASLRFYVDGLGFEMTHKWTPRGKIEWCWLQLGSPGDFVSDDPQADARSYNPVPLAGIPQRAARC